MQMISQGRNLASDSPLLLFLEGLDLISLIHHSILRVPLLPSRRKSAGCSIIIIMRLIL